MVTTGLCAVTAAVLAPWIRVVTANGGPPSRLYEVIGGDPHWILAIGELVITAEPAGYDTVRQWRDGLLGALHSGTGDDEAAFMGRIRRSIVDEFARGDVREFDGWVVASTEARLAAICVLEVRGEMAAT